VIALRPHKRDTAGYIERAFAFLALDFLTSARRGAEVDNNPHFSPRIVAGALGTLQITASAATIDTGILEHYVEEGGASSRAVGRNAG
jgi:hypothetical protein